MAQPFVQVVALLGAAGALSCAAPSAPPSSTTCRTCAIEEVNATDPDGRGED